MFRKLQGKQSQKTIIEMFTKRFFLAPKSWQIFQKQSHHHLLNKIGSLDISNGGSHILQLNVSGETKQSTQQ
jgi:hypothetical protein